MSCMINLYEQIEYVRWIHTFRRSEARSKCGNDESGTMKSTQVIFNELFRDRSVFDQIKLTKKVSNIETNKQGKFWKISRRNSYNNISYMISMLVTDVGENLYWWQVYNVDDRFLTKQSSTSWVTNILILPVTSMLVANVGDKLCWWQLWDADHGFGHFGHQHQLSFYINFGHKHSKDVINIEIQSPTSTNRHQL